ncbi:dimethylmenaquinone methyltransferase [Rhodobacter veldkampii DSM 11550]|uniref:Dimethylmenaquinone methyltransferase n=1 Tax=Phaeovulum veldkampii DSM 11550 TaxID=1185920 RepID=A0A2T4JML2_9RHOB|nr:TraR/DksA C4-type zinc finger protein [Phaeovulum veldkampii]MBK5946689.1 dimethylmenaquinone methyltransferase [Phaeovulum veldkampii DSM 11550]PTE19142.1 dimethylmenaquinone methyltransferase [Phaeovulum veldkampii DSM 11550]TDQ61296.1 TraR/DksA family transcriptional regulator [Phaeovulum veldkampii DSM 11550]
MKSDAERKAQLLARLGQLQARIETIEDELVSHSDRDWEEMAIEREDDEVLEDLGQSAQAEIRMIQAALARIEAGSYGDCAYCGERISEQRLDILPATPFCKDHARAADRR